MDLPRQWQCSLRQALTWLHDFYQDARFWVPCLIPKRINSGSSSEETIRYAFDKLLAKVRPEEELEAGLAAKGLLDATLILMNEYDLVITNVPYLARGKQSPALQKHCEIHFPAAKNDLAASVFSGPLYLQLCHPGGTASIMLPQVALPHLLQEIPRETADQRYGILIARLGMSFPNSNVGF